MIYWKKKFFLPRLVVIGAIALLSACTGERRKQIDPVQRQFDRQLQSSCDAADSILYTKTVINIEKGGTKESHVYPGIKQSMADSVCILQKELKYAFRYYYGAPQSREYYLLRQAGDTLIAELMPEARQRIELQLQKILLQDSTLIYVESHISQRSWLYYTDLRIKVRFDPTGNYQGHDLTSFVKVAAIKTPFHAGIIGKTDKVSE